MRSRMGVYSEAKAKGLWLEPGLLWFDLWREGIFLCALVHYIEGFK